MLLKHAQYKLVLSPFRSYARERGLELEGGNAKTKNFESQQRVNYAEILPCHFTKSVYAETKIRSPATARRTVLLATCQLGHDFYNLIMHKYKLLPTPPRTAFRNDLVTANRFGGLYGGRKVHDIGCRYIFNKTTATRSSCCGFQDQISAL